jgi:hypothetical protein
MRASNTPSRPSGGLWLLPLSLALLASGCDSLFGSSSRPATVNVSPSFLNFDALTETKSLEVEVLDQDENVMTDVPITFTSSNPQVVQVSSNGVVRAVGNGSAEVSVTVGSVIEFVPATVSQVATTLETVSGDEQSGNPQQSVPAPLTVEARDRLGQQVAGANVAFQPTPGSGSVSPAEAVTDGQGRASTSWTLGEVSGLQVVTVRVQGGPQTFFTATSLGGSDPAYRIELHFINPPTPAQRAVFDAAVARWEAVISEPLAPILANLEPGQCGGDSPSLTRPVQNLLIFVVLESIDGPGGTLASAGPCFIRNSNQLPVIGRVRMDEDDLPGLEAQGLLQAVVIHEIAHVLGFGTIWGLKGFLQNPSLPSSPGADTHFTGPRAIAVFDQLGGDTFQGGSKVPVENEQGGQGTRDSHWRRSVFNNELMTGFINPASSPMSRVTIASLEDLGYSVNLGAADNFNIVAALRAPGPESRLHLGDDIYRGPIHVLDEQGRVVRTLPPR